MPYIRFTTNQKLCDNCCNALKSAAGELISILPNKSEAVTMVEINKEAKMYFGGAEVPAMLIQLKLYKASPLEAKKEFTEKIIARASEISGVPVSNIYFNVDEYENWGSKGILK